MNVTLVDHIAVNGDGLDKFMANPWVFVGIFFVVVICVYMITHKHDKKTFVFKVEYEKPSIKTINQRSQKKSSKKQATHVNTKRKS